MNESPDRLKKMRSHARDIFTAAVNAVEPFAAITRYCRIENENLVVRDRSYELSLYKNIFVIGFGKAAAPMAKAIENLLADRIKQSTIIVKYGHTLALERTRLIEAGHPVPDEQGEDGATEILKICKSATEKDLIICLISGGGSSLLSLPANGISLSDKQAVSRVLLDCGASIHEINTIRKHLSQVKGGHLAETAFPATLISLILSDVIGDDPDIIASGPTVPDRSCFQDCLKIISAYDLVKKLPNNVMAHLKNGATGNLPETPKPNSDIFKNTQNVIVGSNMEAILAAKKKADQLGYNTLILSSLIEGETRDVATVHTAIAREILKSGNPVLPPACILSGGETTVTIKGKGLGGRNQEFSLAAVSGISNRGNVVVLSGGTDGNDGPTDAAGAISDSETLKKAMSMGMDPQKYLDNNDAYHFFQRLDSLLITGPTNTNVMDVRILLVNP